MPKIIQPNTLETVRHSLCLWSGLIATDRPDLHNLDTDRDKNTVFEIDTQNEIAIVDAAIEQTMALKKSLQFMVEAAETEPSMTIFKAHIEEARALYS